MGGERNAWKGVKRRLDERAVDGGRRERKGGRYGCMEGGR